MDVSFTREEESFRDEVRTWLSENLVGEFSDLVGRRGLHDEEMWNRRLAWERKLGEAGWIGLGWPKEYGGRGASVVEQVIFNVEYTRADAPGRVGFFGEGLLGPTLMVAGSEEQKQRFLGPILRSEELWCQGYSEPDAGSDLANVQTRAVRDGDEWVVTGQKVWTTLAHVADWCFVVCRTNWEVEAHQGISYLLVPMNQPGITVRPLRQLTGGAEFSEVFFDGARTGASNIVGPVDGGWKIAMTTLGFERGTAFLSRQLEFEREVATLIEIAQKNGSAADPVIRQRLADAYAGVQIMRYSALRGLTSLALRGEIGPEASIGKLYWSHWHRDFGELSMDVLGPWSQVLPEGGYPNLNEQQNIFLSSRAETIYTGSTEIQKNIIGERVLGLPREPRAASATKERR